MAEENIKEVIEEIRGADEETLQSTIEKWFESTRTDGMRLGAKMMSVAVFSVIEKHIKKKTGAKASLRDYTRMTDEIIKIISVQLTTQNNSEETETVEANSNDGTTE